MAAFVLANKGNLSCSGQFCQDGSSFTPYSHYKLLEGAISLLQLGFVRLNYRNMSGLTDQFILYQCPNYQYQAQLDAIEIIHVGNDADKSSVTNSYTYNYTYVDWTTKGIYQHGRYNWISTMTNTYENCLIAISWNPVYTLSTIMTTLQVIRTTYNIKWHIGFLHDTITELYSNNSVAHNFTKTFITNKEARDKYWFACKSSNKYYWHPYAKAFFFFDTDTQEAQNIVFTCFAYTEGPVSACDARFDSTQEPVFTNSTIKSPPRETDSIQEVHEFVAFTRDTSYIALLYVNKNKSYQSRIHKLDITGTNCKSYKAVIGKEIYASEFTNKPNNITSLYAIPNIGLGFVLEKTPGITIIYLDKNGNYDSKKLIQDTLTWKLYQLSVDSVDEPPLFAVTSGHKGSLFRITNIATEIYKNDSMNFFDYPADAGRFHFMVVYPGLCSEPLESATYNHAHVAYVSLEDKVVDFCVEETPVKTCGNGVLDPGEECDDGNVRDGDGCSGTCSIEFGCLCINDPFQTRSLCRENGCGDGVYNPNPPEYEKCDDGNRNNNDGCNHNCTVIEPGWYCGFPGKPCIKVCSNSKLDHYEGPPFAIYSYNEACDDGNTNSGDGCSWDCQEIEPGYECPTPGELCNKLCGNGREDPNEQCDDNNENSSDGCADNCTVEKYYKCPHFGQPCINACGDWRVDDDGIKYYPDYKEQCDDGNTVGLDGCNSTCGYENFCVSPRPIWKSGCYQSCSSGYYNYYASSSPNYFCMAGKYCRSNCSDPAFPGYSTGQFDIFVEDSAYYTIPKSSIGRIRLINLNNEDYAFSFVDAYDGKDYNQEKVMVDGTIQVISHEGLPSTRQSIGSYFIINKGKNSFNIHKLEKDSKGKLSLSKKDFTSHKVSPPQMGSEFYIWWPGPDYLLSRSYNQRSYEIYSFHDGSLNSFEHPEQYPPEKHIGGPFMLEFDVLGNVTMDPVFLHGNMFMPIYVSGYGDTESSSRYEVRMFSAYVTLWEIIKLETIEIPSKITSIASFPEAVIVSIIEGGNYEFYRVHPNKAYQDVAFIGSAPTCTLGWKFVQSRPSPDFPNNSPDVYAFCTATVLYPVRYDESSKLLKIDITDGIHLPDDDRFSRNKNGRFNLNYPYDINGNLFINFAIHNCSDYRVYRWKEIEHISMSVLNLSDRTTHCVDVD